MMYQIRRITTQADWLDDHGIKIYTISAQQKAVEQLQYQTRLQQVKQQRAINWAQTPAFTIFHDGASCKYLILAWWGNDNELFTSVSVYQDGQWLEDNQRYSFCLYDMEVMWAERHFYIDTIYNGSPDINAYRQQRLQIK